MREHFAQRLPQSKQRGPNAAYRKPLKPAERKVFSSKNASSIPNMKAISSSATKSLAVIPRTLARRSTGPKDRRVPQSPPRLHRRLLLGTSHLDLRSTPPQLAAPSPHLSYAFKRHCVAHSFGGNIRVALHLNAVL